MQALSCDQFWMTSDQRGFECLKTKRRTLLKQRSMIGSNKRYDPLLNRICTIRHSIARFSQTKSHDTARITREIPWYVKFHCEFPCVKFHGTPRITREIPWYVKFHCTREIPRHTAFYEELQRKILPRLSWTNTMANNMNSFRIQYAEYRIQNTVNSL